MARKRHMLGPRRSVDAPDQRLMTLLRMAEKRTYDLPERLVRVLNRLVVSYPQPRCPRDLARLAEELSSIEAELPEEVRALVRELSDDGAAEPPSSEHR